MVFAAIRNQGTEAVTSASRAEARETPAVSALPSVLVVDDIEANLVAMEALFEGMACELIKARSGNEALRLLLRHEFAVMLLDVQMPEMDGYEVARYARQNPATRDVPVIFLTAANRDEDRVLRGYGSGAVDFLFKPINPKILRSKVSVFLELYSSRRQVSDGKLALERAYAELKATQSQLIQSAKMASLGELVAGVAHEINNPLSFVVSHLDTAQRSLRTIEGEVAPQLTPAASESWGRAKDRLKEMGAGLERIRELVVKLRTFSRLDEGERKRASLRECVESVLTILAHRIGKNIELSTRFQEPDLVDCYPGILNQAIMNLVSNAIDALEGGGRLDVSTELGAAAYIIRVSDTGGGIPSEVRERVFEPFFTTKPIGQGTGLGLSITYAIVQKHMGSLELSETPGGGTTAVIRIPLDNESRS
jgi:two-component system, NtrC family, sensor kinase